MFNFDDYIHIIHSFYYFRLPLQVSTCNQSIYCNSQLRRTQRSVSVLYWADSGLDFPGSSSNLFSQLLSNQSSNFTFHIPPISFHPRGGSSFLLLPSLPPPLPLNFHHPCIFPTLKKFFNLIPKKWSEVKNTVIL